MQKLFLLGLCLGLSSCLYSTHHFNSGKLLRSGETQVTLGVGRQPIFNCANRANDSLIPDDLACGEANALGGSESVEVNSLVKGSLDYRLGIRDSWWVFPGAELLFHMEAPTNPATLEFGLKLALPQVGQTNFYHNMAGGWGVGVWSDNSFFGEYAFSWQKNRYLWFSNVRLTHLATQINDVLSQEFESSLPRAQRWIMQTGLGLHYGLPNWFLLPDVVIPHLNVTFPQVAGGQHKFLREDTDKVLWDLNFGLGWVF